MKAMVVCAALLSAWSAFGVEVSALPGTTFPDTESNTGIFRRMYEIRSRHVNTSWNLVKVTRRGVCVANENVTVNPAETGFGLTIK